MFIVATVFEVQCDKLKVNLKLYRWHPRGLCHSTNSDFMLSMYLTDKKRSSFVRYSEITETQKIENDGQVKWPFSVKDKSALHLTKNDNRNICVADSTGGVVVDIYEKSTASYIPFEVYISYMLLYPIWKIGPNQLITTYIWKCNVLYPQFL